MQCACAAVQVMKESVSGCLSLMWPEFGVDEFNEHVKSVQCPSEISAHARKHTHTHTHTHARTHTHTHARTHTHIHTHTHKHTHTHTRFRCLGVFNAQCKGSRLIPASSRASGEFFAARISPPVSVSVSVSVSVFLYCATKLLKKHTHTYTNRCAILPCNCAHIYINTQTRICNANT